MTRRAAAIAARVIVLTGLAASAAGCAAQPAYVALPAPAAEGSIHGMVLDGRARPLPDQIVAIGAHKTVTDGDGRFAFDGMPVGYDLVVASPDGTRATVYQALTRRDPIVMHDGVREREPAHTARIAVSFAGTDAARESWQVNFVSPRTFASLRGKGWKAEADRTTNPDPLVVKWDGADTIAGVLVACSMRVEKLDIPLSTFAQKAVTLRAGETAAIELAPTKVPVVRRPRPRVILPQEDPGFQPVYTEEYRLPAAGFAAKGPGRAATPYDIPDLRGFGLHLCAYGFQWNPYLHSSRMQCGIDPAAATALPLPSPPTFTAPAWDAVATPDLRFVWSAVPGAIYRLALESTGGKSAAAPGIAVVTAQTTAGWPDLHAVGIDFPTRLAAYAAVVGVWGPYGSIDELAGPHGFGDHVPRDRWSAESKELALRVGTAQPGEESPRPVDPPAPPPPPEMFQGKRRD